MPDSTHQNVDADFGGRFVVLFHSFPDSVLSGDLLGRQPEHSLYQRGRHWDLMLENGDTLETWAFDAPPTPESTCHATKLPTHRLEYLTYEGPVSGNRGEVTRIISGVYFGALPTQESDEPISIILCWEGQQTTVKMLRQNSDQWQISFGSFAAL